MTVKSIRLQDTLSGKKEIFKPQIENHVRIYCCGPTVYGLTHVGNARAALTLDLVSRVFSWAGYTLEVARNFTDIDDKIIRVSEREKIPAAQIAARFTAAYEDDMRDLLIRLPTYAPKATECIPEILQLISQLVDKGMAYILETPTGKDVYFRVLSFPAYGALSKRSLEDLVTGTRVETEVDKENPADFALWKSSKTNEPWWESPWGPGRPGWHIECSAMIHKLFSDQVDVHMGGIDLIFPHHENEIAQSQALTKKKLATYWLHNGMLEIEKEKMSKSLGNIMSTQDFIARYGPETLRLLVYQQHYRSPMDFSNESIIRNEALVDRLYQAKKMAQSAVEITETLQLPVELQNLSVKIDECLFDDFNSAKALGLILAALRVCYRERKPAYWKAWNDIIPVINKIFGLLEGNPDQAIEANRKRKLQRIGITEEESKKIEEKIREREQARLKKDFATGDLIRKNFESRNILLMDSPDGTTWTVAHDKN